MKKYQPPDIPVSDEVALFERAYRLPTLTGSDRQIKWARNIRHQMLAQIFPTIMDVTVGRSDANDIFARLDDLREEVDARVWIERHKPNKQRPLDYITSVQDANAWQL